MANDKKKLKLHFTDVNQDSISGLLEWLSEQYSIEFDATNPDFLIHSYFGRNHLRYNCVKIAWLGENLQPDFNVSDYAMGFGRITFGDRYRRIPLYRWYIPDYEALFSRNRKILPVDGWKELRKKQRFCTMVVSNPTRGSYFQRFYSAISEYKKIESGGRFKNTTGTPIVNKLDFVRTGKFHLAFENSSSPGYITEKILHAFSARSIPVYWGAKDIAEDFNPEAFIDCRNYNTVEEVVAAIARLDNDDQAYVQKLEEPCFRDGVEPKNLNKREILDWLVSIFDQPIETAVRRNCDYWGKTYQNQMEVAFLKPHVQVLKNVNRAIKNGISKIV